MSKSIQPEIKERLRLLYDAANETIAREQLSTMFEDYNDKASKAMKILEEGFDDIISVFKIFPSKYRKRLRTSNSIERLNQEIRRRERVIRIFPNEASLIRLIGALLMWNMMKSGHLGENIWKWISTFNP